MVSVEVSTEQEERKVEKKTFQKHPHITRRKEILGRHPEISQCMGPNARSLLYTVAVVAAQFACAVFVKDAPWWKVLLVAYTFGATFDHALYVLIHDATHNLFFRNVFWNRVSLLIANLPHVIPSAILFRFYHIQHHIELNKPEKDPDVPMTWEANWVGNSSIRKATWLAFFALFQTARMMFYTHKIPLGGELLWVAANWIVNAIVSLVAYYVLGTSSLVYLTISSLFSVGLHPLGARWIAEHYPTHPFQSTYSYYGNGNAVSFNIGFHNEHHDFPSIAWNRLPELRKIAPEYYDTLFAHPSYTRLLLEFIFDPKWTLTVRYESEKKQ